MALYIVGAWLVIQVADIFFPAWSIPETAIRYLIIAAAACFPIAVLFGWRYDITSQGIVRTEPAESDEPIDLGLHRQDYVILAALLAIGIAVVLGSAEKIQEEIESGPAIAETLVRRENSIAILPFKNLDANADTGYFSDGITEEILHRLSTLGALHVLASNSSFAFRNSDDGPASISEKLGVRYLLQGSVRRDSNHVRVTARLLDQTGFQVWSRTFDRELEGIFVIQSEIASTVASQIVNKIIPMQQLPAGRTTTNMEAYNAYLIGRALFDSRSMGWREKAESAYRSAIELDPGFAPPYAGLAVVLTINTSWGPNWLEGRQLARIALELDPDFAAGHAILGLVYTADGDPENGLVSLRRALEIDPSLGFVYNWIGLPLERLGLEAEARTARNKGLEIDPLNPPLIRNVAAVEGRNGNFDRAEQLLLRLTKLPQPPGWSYEALYELYEIWGRHFDMVNAAKGHIRLHAASDDPWKFELLASAYASLGMNEQADYWYDKIQARLDKNNDRIDSTYFFIRKRGDNARLAAALQRLEDRSVFETGDTLPSYLSYGGLAFIQLGQFEKGLEYLERGIILYQERYQPDAPPDGIDLALLDNHWDTRLVFFVSHQLAFAYQRVNRTDDAQDILQSLQQWYSAVGGNLSADPWNFESIALQRTLLGNNAGALEAFRQAVDLGWAGYYEIINDPAWAETIEAPGFQALLSEAKVNLDRQRATVEAVDAEHDFRQEVERLRAQ